MILLFRSLDLLLLLARTSPREAVAKKTDGLSVFLIDMRAALGGGPRSRTRAASARGCAAASLAAS